MTEEQINHKPNYIRGAFIVCQRIKHKKLEGCFTVKLTAISSIQPVDFDDPHRDECIFYTYKDCAYYAEIHPYELTCAVNSMIFESEKHYEKYPD